MGGRAVKSTEQRTACVAAESLQATLRPPSRNVFVTEPG